MCTSKNAVKAKESQNLPSKSFGDVGAGSAHLSGAKEKQ
jgi:hypothetical protein